MSVTPEQKLAQMEITLPAVSAPVANYVGWTVCVCDGCADTKATSCNSSRIMLRTSSAVSVLLPLLSKAYPIAAMMNLLIEPYSFRSMD